MKQTLAKEHHAFFQKHRAIEFDDIFSSQQLTLLNEEVNAALAHRLQTEADRLYHQPALALYMAGRDIWRHNLALRKMICHTQLAKIAADLLQQTSLRMGFDQIIPSRPALSEFLAKQDCLTQLFHHPQTLQDFSHLQGTLGGVLICLHAGEPLVDLVNDCEEINIFSQHTGNVVFFDAEKPIDFPQLTHIRQGRYLLIGYTHANSTYQLKENDPHAHELKHIGYGFGDRLTEKLNPIVVR